MQILSNLFIPKILTDVTEYLQKENINLSSKFSDGRMNSSINEDEIIKKSRQKFEIIVPKARAWYDFAIEDKKEFYPVNIKVTDTTHADNLNCKLKIIA